MALETFPEKYDRMRALVGDLHSENPGPIGGYTILHQKSLAEGALSRKTKELMALGMAITAMCDGCIAYHVHDALKAGASRDELKETLAVAVMMGGGKAMMYACEALDAMNQFRDLGFEQQQFNDLQAP
ncbi:MAG: carboxymuconolactone decarboxylase family protein [Bdellovibrio sp.]